MGIRAVVHLGPIKSGTTALSRYLTAATTRGVLPDSVVYPMDALWFGRTGGIVRQRDELESLGRDARDPAAFAVPGTSDALAAVAAHLRSTGIDGAAAIFVVETGGARLDPDLLTAALRAHFDEVEYVIMTRRQDKAVASIVAQRVKMWNGGFSLDPRAYVADGDDDIVALDFARALDRWTGADRTVHLIPYLEDEQGTFASIERIFRTVRLPDPPYTEGIEGRRIHPTFSAEGMLKLVEIKQRHARWGWVPGVAGRLHKQFQDTIRIYHGTAISGGLEPSGRQFKPWTLSPDDAAWVLESFRVSNERMLATVDQIKNADDWRLWSEALGGER